MTDQPVGLQISQSVGYNSGLCFHRCVLLKRVWQIYPLKISKKRNFKIFKKKPLKSYLSGVKIIIKQ